MSKNIYLISCSLSEEKLYKIGYTKRAVKQRIKELKTGNPSEFEIEKVYIAEDYSASIENNLHKYFAHKLIEGEWFHLSIEDVNNFESLCEKFYNNFNMIQKNNTYLIDRDFKYK